LVLLTTICADDPAIGVTSLEPLASRGDLVLANVAHPEKHLALQTLG